MDRDDIRIDGAKPKSKGNPAAFKDSAIEDWKRGLE
jgi:hypothetical protein